MSRAEHAASIFGIGVLLLLAVALYTVGPLWGEWGFGATFGWSARCFLGYTLFWNKKASHAADQP